MILKKRKVFNKKFKSSDLEKMKMKLENEGIGSKAWSNIAHINLNISTNK